MKRKVSILIALSVLILSFQISTLGQTAGAIAGTVTDTNGAVLPNATVTVRGEGGQEFTALTRENGTYRIPAVANGYYTVAITSTGFKTSNISNVKVDVGLPTTVDAVLEIGDVQQTVEVTGGGEILQTQTATIGTTITGRQITESPIASRDALDLIGQLPGTATVGRPRSASINGLPKSSVTITIDGVDAQDNVIRSSDGYHTLVRPRVDAIEEVTVSTSNPGAESSGDGAVQIKFVTKRGTNDYTGGLFWQHRNSALNAAYWYNNRDTKRDPVTGFEPDRRTKVRLNQYGGRFGGPIPFLNFGDGGGPLFNSGRNKAFFFVNYEEFRQPESTLRTRVILTPDAQAGLFRYQVGAETRSVDLLSLAGANGQLATPDPTISSLLSRIRTAVGTTGTITPISGAPNRQNYNWFPVGAELRKFLAMRFDFNLTKDHSLEVVVNRQDFTPSKDFLNNVEERFPGFPFATLESPRNSYAMAVRSNFGSKFVNEARYAVAGNESTFGGNVTPEDFAIQGGYNLNINPTGVPINTATARNSRSTRLTPSFDFTDTLTWIAGSHNISFGGQYKLIRSESINTSRVVPSVSFALDSSDPAFGVFNATALPGASAAQLTEARNLYAVLVGRVSSYLTNAFLTADGTYVENAEQTQIAKQRTYGLFAQDSWRARPNLTINFGVRWQPQTAFTVLTDNYARLSSFNDVFGVSGPGNIFKPGTLEGKVPTVVGMEVGEKAYNDDMNNFAPSIGVAWTPDFNSEGFFGKLFGSNGKSVFRGGFSKAFVREGSGIVGNIIGANPGGALTLTRSLANGNLTVGTNLRDANNPNLTAPFFPDSPVYPFALTVADSTNAFNPDLKTGSVNSFSFGYQREIDKNTVVEFRYVGNRGINLQRQYNINEFNTIENGFADEFALAQNNLYANLAAGRGATFAYFGADSGTSPLPIMLSYFNNAANFDPSNPARYSAANFTNTTLVAALSRNNPNIIGAGTTPTGFAGTNFENNAARRANAIANGLPANFFYVNPTTGVNGSFVVDNSTQSSYDSGVIEVRRRLSDGLRFQTSYVWSKAMSNAYQSSSALFAGFTQRENGLELAKNVQAFDIRHQFKFDATYDLPFGRGRAFFSDANWLTNALLGGFTVLPAVRWQSGTPFSLGNVQLVGMTAKELQKEVGVYKNSVIDGVQVVTYLPEDIILNTRRAFDINVATATGYGATFGGAPSGRFIAPAGYGNCQQTYAGECGFNNLILYGPSFFKFDITLAKKFIISEKTNVELRATLLDALNTPNFRVGGFAADVVAPAVGSATFGQMGNGSAYQDLSTTNDPGGRVIDLMLRINF